MKENGFILKKERSRQYRAETIMDEGYTNTPAQAKYLLYSLEQSARSIGLYANLDKTKFMCFKTNSNQ